MARTAALTGLPIALVACLAQLPASAIAQAPDQATAEAQRPTIRVLLPRDLRATGNQSSVSIERPSHDGPDARTDQDVAPVHPDTKTPRNPSRAGAAASRRETSRSRQSQSQSQSQSHRQAQKVTKEDAALNQFRIKPIEVRVIPGPNDPPPAPPPRQNR